MRNECVVSILCATFNHEKYIERAIEGFLNQKTNFRYEIIIHDDASTDGTSNILKKYASLYPDRIRVIQQVENKYSKGIDIYHKFIYPLVRAKYIALCEGDDSWCDCDKLQKQVDILERHKDIDICSHAANMICNGKLMKIIAPTVNDAIISLEDVILGGGGFVATSSILIRSDVLMSSMIRKKYPMDYAIQIVGATRGGMYYINDVMSVYNYYTENSWTRTANSNIQYSIKWYSNVINMLTQYNEDIYKNRTTAIDRALINANIKLLEQKGCQFEKICKYHSYLNLKDKIYTIIKMFLGNRLVRWLRELRYASLGKSV